MSRRWYRGADFDTAAVDWVRFAQFALPIDADTNVYTVSIFGEAEGKAEFRLAVDGVMAKLFIGMSDGPRARTVVDGAIFQVDPRAPLIELAAFDTPRKVQIFVRTTRRFTIKNWMVTIAPSLCG